jgi:hypothetical protein
MIAFAIWARRFLLPSAIFLAHTANVFATSLSQEFRYAYPLYLTAALTLTLLYPTIQAARGKSPDRSGSDAQVPGRLEPPLHEGDPDSA